MTLNRNKDVPVTSNPKINKKRTLFDPGVKRRLTSLKHGVVTPFYVREVYPGDTWIVDHTAFIRSDITQKVPLDDVTLDTYYFYVPYRVIYPDFYRVFGEKRNKYDNSEYKIPQITLAPCTTDNSNKGFTNSFLDQLVYRLNYSQSGPYQQKDTISALPIVAYYSIINEYFLDENLDPQIPIADLLDTTQFDLNGRHWDDFSPTQEIPQSMLNNYGSLGLYQANKKFDLFTSGLISPAKTFGANTTIPLGTSAPLMLLENAYGLNSATQGLYKTDSIFTNVKDGDQGAIMQLNTAGGASQTSTKLAVDLSTAVSADIQTFRTSLIIYSYYEMRGTIGTRRVEQLKQWGLDVSAADLDIPEYLGGESIPLSNIPVLSTQSASLGEMSGLGATMVFNDNNAWSKSFNEMGVIIGLAVTRVHHTYTQGKDNRIWSKLTDLDFYHWIYEALGNVGLRNDYIYNDPGDGKNTEIFNFSPAWNPERTDWNVLSGIFSPMSGEKYIDFRTFWSYADYYEGRPVFSSEWLKETPHNVARTMTGRLIPNASDLNGQQYLIEFKVHAKWARIMRSHAKPANLVGVYW